jgi:hypothetical protein
MEVHKILRTSFREYESIKKAPSKAYKARFLSQRQGFKREERNHLGTHVM